VTIDNRIDQASRIKRRQHIGECRKQHHAKGYGHAHRLFAPVGPGESKNAAESTAAPGNTKKSHDNCPMLEHRPQ
jgi:hypothetical protein